jgi:hypothetical protein
VFLLKLLKPLFLYLCLLIHPYFQISLQCSRLKKTWETKLSYVIFFFISPRYHSPIAYSVWKLGSQNHFKFTFQTQLVVLSTFSFKMSFLSRNAQSGTGPVLFTWTTQSSSSWPLSFINVFLKHILEFLS